MGRGQRGAGWALPAPPSVASRENPVSRARLGESFARSAVCETMAMVGGVRLFGFPASTLLTWSDEASGGGTPIPSCPSALKGAPERAALPPTAPTPRSARGWLQCGRRARQGPGAGNRATLVQHALRVHQERRVQQDTRLQRGATVRDTDAGPGLVASPGGDAPTGPDSGPSSSCGAWSSLRSAAETCPFEAGPPELTVLPGAPFPQMCLLGGPPSRVLRLLPGPQSSVVSVVMETVAEP